MDKGKVPCADTEGISHSSEGVFSASSELLDFAKRNSLSHAHAQSWLLSPSLTVNIN